MTAECLRHVAGKARRRHSGGLNECRPPKLLARPPRLRSAPATMSKRATSFSPGKRWTACSSRRRQPRNANGVSSISPGSAAKPATTLKGLNPSRIRGDGTPMGFMILATRIPGLCSCLEPTLGWMMKRRWRCEATAAPGVARGAHQGAHRGNRTERGNREPAPAGHEEAASAMVEDRAGGRHGGKVNHPCRFPQRREALLSTKISNTNGWSQCSLLFL